MTATQQDIKEFTERYEKQVDKTHKEMIKLTWFMRGGVTLSEIYEMPVNHIEYINDAIKDNFEMSKKAGTPII